MVTIWLSPQKDYSFVSWEWLNTMPCYRPGRNSFVKQTKCWLHPQYVVSKAVHGINAEVTEGVWELTQRSRRGGRRWYCSSRKIQEGSTASSTVLQQVINSVLTHKQATTHCVNPFSSSADTRTERNLWDDGEVNADLLCVDTTTLNVWQIWQKVADWPEICLRDSHFSVPVSALTSDSVLNHS